MKRKPVITAARIEQSSFAPYYPSTQMADFDNYLSVDIPHVNYTFEQVRDWYLKDDPDYEPVYIRAEYFPINWKSKIGNSDANSNLKTSYREAIRKGDIAIREDGMIYILNWQVQHNPNNQSTQAINYNLMLCVERMIPKEQDERGYVITPQHIGIVCPDIPAVLTEYAGRPDYATAYNTPGVHADHVMSGQVQANDYTMRIRINDEFDWLQDRYRIINVNYAEVDPKDSRGLINFHARRVAGAFMDVG